MKKWLWLLGLLASAHLLSSCTSKKSAEAQTYEIRPALDTIVVKIRVNGSVEPKNRLEIKPQVSGRIESILVNEGQKVKKGEVLAWMSSSDRAALIDAARSKGKSELKKWEDIYKPAPIISPMDGFITARYKEPGQTVSLSDVILVIADKLIIQVNVDETDLRSISTGLKANIILDAYPGQKFSGAIDHIAYESQVINNVTIYEVKVRPDSVPPAFRSGMSATVEVTAQKKEGILTVPADAVSQNADGKFVLVKTDNPKKPKRTKIVTGISNEKLTEVISGVSENDTILVTKKDLSKSSGTQFRGPMSMFGSSGASSTRRK